MAFKNYYEILGVDQSASPDDIKDAYRKTVQKYKSDTNETTEYRSQMLKQVNEAIEVLSNIDKKQAYDNTIGIMDQAVVINSIQHDSGPAEKQVSQSDAEVIAELIKKHFEKEKILREKHDALLAVTNARPKAYLTSVKVIFCAIIVGVAYYLHSPNRFQFDFADEKKENFTYEYYTNDTTLIYEKPELKKKTKVLKGVSKGTGFNTISETTHFFKIAYINESGRNQEGYIKKELLERSSQIPF